MSEYKLVPVEPTQDMLSAMAECDGYLPGDRDRPGLTRWEDYWRMAIAAAPAAPAAPAWTQEQIDAINAWAERSLTKMEPAPADPAPDVCNWMQDGPESNGYETQCRQLFNVDPDCDEPLSDWMKFCCFCGKPLKEVPFAEEDDDEA